MSILASYYIMCTQYLNIGFVLKAEQIFFSGEPIFLVIKMLWRLNIK